METFFDFPLLVDDEEEEDWNALVELLVFPRAARRNRLRTDFFTALNDREFVERFRLSKQCVQLITDKIREGIRSRTTK